MKNQMFSQIKNTLQDSMNQSPDFVIREFNVANHKIALCYLKSMIDKILLTEAILSPLLEIKEEQDLKIKNVSEKVVLTVVSKISPDKTTIQDELLNNQAVYFNDFEEGFCSFDIEDYVQRVPSEPPTSAVLSGPREGFTEDIKTNVSLLRRRLATQSLCFIDLTVGKYSNTKVSVAYLKGVASDKVVKKIVERIKKIDIDGIINSNYIAQFLEEKPYSFFKQVGTAEKPDIIAGKMLEGRVAIIVNNSPIVLTLPYIYIEDLQSGNDYYGRAQHATFIRWIRIIGILLTCIVPGAYVALRLYHYKVIPLKFLISITNSTLNIPFTPFFELLFILILFEVLYEVSLRLPRYLGLATSIVGALVLGDTGVQAGLISPPGVMIIAMSVIAVYTIPDQAFQLSMLRLYFLLLGGMFGVYGIIAGMVFIICHLNAFNEYGSPYFAPLSPFIAEDNKDALIKKPLIAMTKRPKSIKRDEKNSKRLDNEKHN